MENLNHIIPELFLAMSIMALLIIGVFYKNSFNLIFKSSIIVLFVTLVFLFNYSSNLSYKLFNDSYIIDNLSHFMKVLTLFVSIFVMFSSYDYIKSISIKT